MVEKMDGELLYKGFVAGARAVSQERDHLNKINVFPVPDGDTGNNLSATLNAVSLVAPDKAFGSSLQAIAQALLAGARGNSGIIFASFVNGLALDMGSSTTQLSTRNFAEIVSKAVPHAYRAISNPVEGTMLTVMHDWAKEVLNQGERAKDFLELFAGTMRVARASLEATPQKLKVLRDARVVDSGAKGFVLFLEGFAASLHGKAAGEQQPAAATQSKATQVDGATFTHRYCTEVLLTGAENAVEKVRALAEQAGDSVVVAGGPGGLKVHLHTSDPESFVFSVRDKGQLVQQKVEDMLRQHEMRHARQADIALVTDSIADLPQALLDEHQIHVIPVNMMIEGVGYLDKLTITPKRFYGLLDAITEYPTSAQPNLHYVTERLQEIKEHYPATIVISVAARLSGTFNVFEQAAASIRQDGYPITVLDSKLNSGAQGLLVLRAAEEISRGKSYQKVIAGITAEIPNSYILVSVVDFSNMVRGGRVSPLKGKVAKLLNLQPIVSLDKEGKGSIHATAFSRGGVMKKILSQLATWQKRDGIKSFAVVHAQSADRAMGFAAEISNLTGMNPVFVTEISTVVGLSAGKGAVAVAVVIGK